MLGRTVVVGRIEHTAGVLLQGLLFDFDGLIIDTETSEYEATAAVFADHGLELSRDLWISFIGRVDHPHWADLLAEGLGRELDDREAVIADRRARSAVAIAREPIRPGIVALLDEAEAAGVPVAVASSSPRYWVEGHLDRIGLRPRFDAIATRDDVAEGRAKPWPDLYLLAAERLGADPARCVAIEDSPAGVEAGVAAGCTTVAVPAGMTVALDFGPAHLIVPDLAAVALTDLERLVAARHS